MKKSLKIILLFGTAAAFVACAQTEQPKQTSQSQTANTAKSTPIAQASPPPAAPLGKEIYMANCAACHKDDGTGGEMTIEGKTIKPDDLTSAKIKGFDNRKLINYVYNGVVDEGMPAFKDKLNEAEIREVVKYVREGIQKLPADPSAAK